MLDNVTIVELVAFLESVLKFGATIVAIAVAVKKILKKLMEEQAGEMKERFDKIDERFDKVDERLDKTDANVKKIDLENCKNFLVEILSKAEHGGQIDEIETQRFWEEFEHYTENGGNSYIRQKVDKLKDEGKL